MKLWRRIFDRPSERSGRSGTTRRAAHVTPSNSRRHVPEEEIEEPLASDIEAETSETFADPLSSDAQRLAESQTHRNIASGRDEQLATAASPVDTARRPSPGAETFASDELETAAQPLSYGIASDVGMLRDNNEDASFAMHWHSITIEDRPDFGFFVVADGMGGHLDGEKAAGIAVETLAAEMMETIYAPLLRDFHAADSPTILDALVSAAEKANLAVIKRVPGGGTTLSTVAVIGNLAYLVHVGDSRAYLIHDDQIEQLTTDHTLVQRLIEMKEITPEEAEFYPQKNVLYRAIGQNEQLKVERMIRTLPPSSQMIICSDGLWDLVEDETMKRVAQESATPQHACDALISLANERGGTDNITVIILKTPGTSSRS